MTVNIPVEPKFAFILLLHTSYLYCISLFRMSCSNVPVSICGVVVSAPRGWIGSRFVLTNDFLELTPLKHPGISIELFVGRQTGNLPGRRVDGWAGVAGVVAVYHL